MESDFKAGRKEYSFEEFRKNSREFVDLCGQCPLTLQWKLVTIENDFLPPFLKTYLSCEHELNKEEDNVIIHLEIFYSDTFNLPEIYFRIISSEGKPLSLEDSLEFLLTMKNKLKEIEKPHFLLTEKIHPIKKLVYFYIHECQMKELLSLFGKQEQDNFSLFETNFLLCWLSIIFKIIGHPDLEISSSILKKLTPTQK